MRGIIARVGGKSKIADFIVSKFPEEAKETYVEPFVGGGSIFFSKPYESKVEVINDKDKDIADIYKDYKVVNDLHKKNFNPSRKQFVKLQSQTNFKDKTDRLYRNVYLSRFSFRGNRKGYVGEKKEKQTEGTSVSYKNPLYNKKYTDRLKRVNVFNKDFKEMIKKYDSKNTFFYLDPPYSRSVDVKDYEEVGITIEEIYNSLKNIEGKFLLSYDDNKDVRKLFKGYKIKKIKTKYETSGNPFEVVELLISNY